MKVILRQNVDKLGRTGEFVTVKDGYARNYLIPRNLAYFASPKSLKSLEIEKKQHERRQAKERESAESIASKLSELNVSIAMKVGEEGKLYGSVTSQMIAGELAKLGYQIDKKHIIIEEPIKSMGVFDVKVKLHFDITASVKVWVINVDENQTNMSEESQQEIVEESQTVINEENLPRESQDNLMPDLEESAG